jgi:hypothetical protein
MIPSCISLKRGLSMAPKMDDKSEKLVEEMIIEQGIRDGSINWMVVTVMSSWRSSDYSEVLINYFRENATWDEGGTVEMNVKCADGLKCEKRGPTQKMVNSVPE